MIYSVFFFLWTAMIGCVLICISRTHTINIRRFIGQLEYDSFLRDQKLRERLYAKGSHEANDAFKSKFFLFWIMHPTNSSWVRYPKDNVR